MTRASLRRWSAVHTWTSLISTLFLLVICITGLPLLFKDEIADFLDDGKPYAALPADAPRASIDLLVEKSHTLYPGEVILSIFVDDDEPQVVISMASTWETYRKNLDARHWIKFDARTAEVLKQSKPFGGDGLSFLVVVFNLHKELFAGLPGELFVGAMGLCLVAALISGVVLYGPFMRKLQFGNVRRHRARRIKWLDLHNLLGIATMLWLLVVSVTGFVNALSTPLFGLWQQTDVAALLASMKSRQLGDGPLSSVQAAFDSAQRALPEMQIVSAIYPGSPFGSPVHYAIWMKGKEPLTSRLFSPVLVNASTGAMEGVVEMPWYLRALEVARPLHFGDYGGTPLKLIWGAFDIIAIIVLSSGLYLWFVRRRASHHVEETLAESDAASQAAI